MADFHFLRPWWLLAFLPAVLICWSIVGRQDQAAAWHKFIDAHLLQHLLVGKTDKARVRPIHMLLLIWFLCTLALAGPTHEREPAPFADDEAGLMVIMKVSGTMNSTDVQPSRLDRAKHKLCDIIRIRSGSSTGLIVYSGSAHLVMPLTEDGRIINVMVEDLEPELMPVDGDSLAEALRLARIAFLRAGVSGSVLVMADSVSTTEFAAVSEAGVGLPVQFLAVVAASSPVDKGLGLAAEQLGAPVVKLTVDQTDVDQLSRTAEAKMISVVDSDTGERWRDDGHLFLPLIVLCALMCFRQGWVVR